MYFTDHDIGLVLDAVRVLGELHEVPANEMTALFDAMHYENLRIVVDDLLRVLQNRQTLTSLARARPLAS